VIEDGLHRGELVEEAERLRDPAHVRAYTRGEWGALLAGAGLEVLDEAEHAKRHELEQWLSCTGCDGETARRVRALLAHVTDRDDDTWLDRKLIVKARRRHEDPRCRRIRCSGAPRRRT
jgi:hypothetical protein